MKTIEEAAAYLKTVARWTDDKGEWAKPGPTHSELYEFKTTIKLGEANSKFEGSNVDEVVSEDGEVLKDWATWTVSFDGVGTAHLHLCDLTDAEDSSTWAELWLEKEPWWNGDDPFECSWEQIADIVSALPSADRDTYLRLVSRSSELSGVLNSHGILVPDHKP
ncbi:hypothetical protein G6L37_00640 [Agrobacterium rubi]|nr:hypothetical protein [Agrobacterium rubi]NTF23897.1 hypothetical protein [Agrobacterium rubi]